MHQETLIIMILGANLMKSKSSKMQELSKVRHYQKIFFLLTIVGTVLTKQELINKAKEEHK